jgi:YggT family protein
MQAVLYVLLQVLDLYMYILIASAIMSWLVAFNVVNLRNQVVAAIAGFLYTMTEPLLRPIRRLMPNTGGLDLSFLVLWFGIILLQQVIIRYVYPYVF